MAQQAVEVLRVTAGNASEYTFEGTNTWVIGVAGRDDAILVDPGPDEPGHMDAVERLLSERGMGLREVILTHAHDDHIGNLWRVATRAPHVRVHSLLTGYPEALETSGARIRVLPAPGHTHDSVCLWNEATGELFTGDTVLGDGPTMIDHPDGSLSDYLETLERLGALPGLTALLPGHGGVRTDPYEVIGWNLAHRRRRVAAVEQVVARFGGDAERITDHCYPSLSTPLRIGALQNTRAALDYLSQKADDGPSDRTGEPFAHSPGEA